MEPILRSVKVLKQDAEEIGYEGKEVLEYVKQQHALDREESSDWRDTQKMQAQTDVESLKPSKMKWRNQTVTCYILNTTPRMLVG